MKNCISDLILNLWKLGGIYTQNRWQRLTLRPTIATVENIMETSNKIFNKTFNKTYKIKKDGN